MPGFAGPIISFFKDFLNYADAPLNVKLTGAERHYIGEIPVHNRLIVVWDYVERADYYDVALIPDGEAIENVPYRRVDAAAVKDAHWNEVDFEDVEYDGYFPGVVFDDATINTKYTAAVRSVYNEKFSTWIYSNTMDSSTPLTATIVADSFGATIEGIYRGIHIYWQSLNAYKVRVELSINGGDTQNYTYKADNCFIKLAEDTIIDSIFLYPYNVEMQQGTAQEISGGPWTVKTLRAADADYNDKRGKVVAVIDNDNEIISTVPVNGHPSSNIGTALSKITSTGKLATADDIAADGTTYRRMAGTKEDGWDTSKTITDNNLEAGGLKKGRTLGGIYTIDATTGELKLTSGGSTIIDTDGSLKKNVIGTDDSVLIDTTNKRLGSDAEAPTVGTKGIVGGYFSTSAHARITVEKDIDGIMTDGYLQLDNITNFNAAGGWLYIANREIGASPMAWKTTYSGVDTTNKRLTGLPSNILSWYEKRTYSSAWQVATDGYTDYDTMEVGFIVGTGNDVDEFPQRAVIDKYNDSILIIDADGTVAAEFDGVNLNLPTGTITGGKYQTALSGKRIVFDQADNSLRFFDSSGEVITIDDNIFATESGMKITDGIVFIDNEGISNLRGILLQCDWNAYTSEPNPLINSDLKLTGTAGGDGEIVGHALYVRNQVAAQSDDVIALRVYVTNQISGTITGRKIAIDLSEGDLRIADQIDSDDTTDAVSTTTGAITTLGGISAAKAIFAGTGGFKVGNVTMGPSNLTSSSQYEVGTAGAPIYAVNVSNSIKNTGTADSTSSSTGSVILSGGMGVAKNVVVGNNVDVGDAYKQDGSEIINSSGEQTGLFKTRSYLNFGFSGTISNGEDYLHAAGVDPGVITLPYDCSITAIGLNGSSAITTSGLQDVIAVEIEFAEDNSSSFSKKGTTKTLFPYAPTTRYSATLDSITDLTFTAGQRIRVKVVAFDGTTSATIVKPQCTLTLLSE